VDLRLSGRFDAAIFDLFGTLVPEFPRSSFFEAVRAAAAVLGADPDAFEAEWSRTALARQTGAYPGGMAENVHAILDRLGMPWAPDDLIARALAPRDALYERWFHPRPGAIEVLTELRARDVPLALISMCAPDTPAMWRASAFAGLVDVEVFSSEVGFRKPDPAIYRYAADRLDVEPARCLYCGDGAYAELTGAEAVGMTAVMIDDPAVDRAEQLRPEGEDWHGASVADLRELLAYFDREPGARE
jgi:putative hydrolase of the HAD superfamily